MALLSHFASSLALALLSATAGDVPCNPGLALACNADDSLMLLQQSLRRGVSPISRPGGSEGHDIELEEMPTTIPQSCEGDNLISRWKTELCQNGVPDKRWSYSPSGELLGRDQELCETDISCERRLNGTWSHPHLVLDGPNPSGLLVVFLPGTGSPPSAYSRVLKAAGRAGHLVIGLSYLSLPIAVLQTDIWCQPNPPGHLSRPHECIEEIHHQTLFGKESVPDWLKGKSGGIWPTERQDSVEALVTAIIEQRAWNCFLKDGKVNWQKVIISGHSQGGSHAAYLSQVSKVQAVLFSGPQELDPGGQMWLDLQVSEGIKRRSLSSLHEECAAEPIVPTAFCVAGQLDENLHRMGLGRQSFWNGTGVPEDLSNVVSTARLENNDGRAYHRSVAANNAPAGADELWQQLFSGFETPLYKVN